MAYLRRNVVAEAPYEEQSMYLSEAHEENRKHFHWGTRGILHDQPIQYRPLYELTTEHIEAILRTQAQIKGSYVEELFKEELRHRIASGQI